MANNGSWTWLPGLDLKGVLLRELHVISRNWPALGALTFDKGDKDELL